MKNRWETLLLALTYDLQFAENHGTLDQVNRPEMVEIHDTKNSI